MKKEKKTGEKSRLFSAAYYKELMHEEKKSVLVVYIVLRIFVIAAAVFSGLNGDWENVFVCLLVLGLFLLPNILERKLDVTLPSTLEIIIIIFIFAAEILGELSSFFVRYAYWDTMLHTTWGFLCAAVGFSLVDLLNDSGRVKLRLSPAYLALGAFCFSMTIGVIWEFFEFAMDYFLHMDMQKDTIIHAFSSVNLDPTMSNIPVRISDITDVAVNGRSLGLGGYLDIGLYDTMADLFVNFIGATVFSVIGYIDARTGGKMKLAHSFIPRVDRDDK